MRARRLALVAVLAALVGVGIAEARYESARAAWREVSDVGRADYDRAASDAAYRGVDDALTWVERFARGGAVVMVVAVVAAARSSPSPSPSTPRFALAVDALVVGLGASLWLVSFSSPGLALSARWLALGATVALAANARARRTSLAALLVDRLRR